MIAKLNIQTALRNGRTILEGSYYTTPFKLVNVTEDKTQNLLKLMVMSSSPGILDRDEYRVKIVVADGCALEMQTQSYQRLFKMKQGASQQMEITLEPQSSFTYLPHPSVPHAASNFTSKNKIYLSDHCTLIWGEVLTCGRKLSGEAFQFEKYHSITEVYLNKRLVVKENSTLMQPALTSVHKLGQMEGYSHQASLLFIADNFDVNSIIAAVTTVLTLYTDITFGISALPVKGLIVRLLGHKGEQLHIILKRLSLLLSVTPANVKDSSAHHKLETYAG